MSKEPKSDDFLDECRAFCRRHDMELSTLSQRSLSNATAINRLPKMTKRVEERMSRVRATMKAIEDKSRFTK